MLWTEHGKEKEEWLWTTDVRQQQDREIQAFELERWLMTLCKRTTPGETWNAAYNSGHPGARNMNANWNWDNKVPVGWSGEGRPYLIREN